jgi:hypothetical protein
MNYLFEANDYETTGKLGKDLNKEFPEYFFRCFPSSINEMDVVFRVFKLKESFITPMAVFNYLDICTVS